MKKTYIYASLFAAALMVVACDEDYKDWAEPQSYAQEANASAASGVMTQAVTAISEESADETIVLANASASDATISFTSLSLDGTDIPFTSENGALTVALSDLSSAVQDKFKSLASVEREIELVTSIVSVDEMGQALVIGDQTISLKYTPAALPANASESAYYYIGGYNGWALDAPTPFESNGDGTYSLTIEIGDGEWFAFLPQSAVDAQDWNMLFRAPSNGCTDTFGYLNNDPTTGYSFNCETGGTYTFTLDMNNYTFSYVPYVAALYYAGDANGWSFSPMVQWGDDFVGFYYVNAVDNSSTWGFKICMADNWDEPQYGAGDEAGTVALGGGNIDLGQADGFYQINLNQAQLTVSLTEITSISIIGTVNGSWDTDTDLTFDVDNKVWTVTADLTAGEFKFRANHDWSLSWGGELDALTADNGSNIALAEDGNYTITLAPNANGYGVATITKN